MRDGDQETMDGTVAINEQHPSVRVHPWRGGQADRWSASASDERRITVARLPQGKNRMIAYRRHAQR